MAVSKTKIPDRKSLTKKYGSNSGIASDILVEGEDSLWLPSRFITLNHVMGGGIPYGRIIELFGEESSGKSLLALDFAYAAQRLGGMVCYLDAEQSFSAHWAKQNGLKLDQLEIYSETSVEKISDWWRDMAIYYRDQLTNNEPILFIIDSMAALDCEDNINSDQLDAKAEMGNRAKAIYKMFRTRNQLMAELGITTICINQLRKKVGAGQFEDPDTTPGGKALAFFASIRLGLYRGRQLKEKINGVDTRVGSHTSIRTIKNKVAPAGDTISKAKVYFNPRTKRKMGFYRYFGLGDTLTETGVITRKKGSAFYKYNEKTLAQGEDNLIELISKDADIRKELIESSGINTISKTKKQISNINQNLYPVE